MKKVEDLISSASSVHSRYSAGRIERETVREWVLGLSDYPEPHGQRIMAARAWFKSQKEDMTPEEMKAADLDNLRKIFQP